MADGPVGGACDSTVHHWQELMVKEVFLFHGDQ